MILWWRTLKQFVFYFHITLKVQLFLLHKVHLFRSSSNNLCIIKLSHDEILDRLLSLDGKKVLVRTKYIQFMQRDMHTHLQQLFIQSLFLGIFLDIWQSACVIPCHKVGQNHQVQDYQPICKLRVFGNDFEWLIYKSIYFQVKIQVIPEQHVFFTNKSTEANLLC